MNIALILSSGIGLRFGSNTPKQYLPLCGNEAISYVIDAAKKAKSIDKIIVVANVPFTEEIKQIYGVETTEGGATRNVSFRNGVDYVKTHYACDRLIVLDAVRPLVTGELIDEYVKKLDEYEVCVTTKKITDSLCSYDSHICDRDRFFLTSSPMSFRFGPLDEYLDADSPLVEVLQMMPESTKTFYNYGFPQNYKITFSDDIPFIELMMKKYNRC